jgi:hypothetical protein
MKMNAHISQPWVIIPAVSLFIINTFQLHESSLPSAFVCVPHRHKLMLPVRFHLFRQGDKRYNQRDCVVVSVNVFFRWGIRIGFKLFEKPHKKNSEITKINAIVLETSVVTMPFGSDVFISQCPRLVVYCKFRVVHTFVITLKRLCFV